MKAWNWCALLLLATGCGGAARSGMPATSGGTDLEQLERDLASADGRLQRELGTTATPSAAPAGPGEATAATPSSDVSQAPAEPEAEPAKASESESGAAQGNARAQSTPEDRCSVACRAYQSMRRSAERICELTGAGDQHCTRARRRVDAARGQLERSPCHCE